MRKKFITIFSNFLSHHVQSKKKKKKKFPIFRQKKKKKKKKNQPNTLLNKKPNPTKPTQINLISLSLSLSLPIEFSHSLSLWSPMNPLLAKDPKLCLSWPRAVVIGLMRITRMRICFKPKNLDLLLIHKKHKKEKKKKNPRSA